MLVPSALLGSLALAAAPTWNAAPAPESVSAPVDVLFLGNSYTGFNDLPGMLAGLAGSAGIAVNVTANVPGGCTLGSPQGGLQHTQNQSSQALLAQGAWDVVVLQEQSVTPSIAATKNQFMVPAALALGGAARAASPDVQMLLYQTWGRANGGTYCWSQWCSPAFADFDAMQDALTAAYAETEAALDAAYGVDFATVAPVGEAWRQFFQEQPTLPLHGPDGSHPNPQGTYLAACVLFTTLFDQSPVGLGFTAGLPESDALLLQDLAARAHFAPLCGQTAYGEPLAGGSAGWDLALTGDLSLGSDLTFDASALPPGADGAWFAVALAPANVPFGDGALLIDATALVLPLTFLPAASPTFTGTLPTTPGLAGLELFAQSASWTGDWQMSGALRLVLCP